MKYAMKNDPLFYPPHGNFALDFQVVTPYSFVLLPGIFNGIFSTYAL
jgi:hypothetical protein